MEIINLFKEIEAGNLEKKESKKYLLESNNFVVYGAGEDFRSFRKNVLDPFKLIPFVIIDEKFPKDRFFMTGPCHPDDFILEADDTDMIAVIALGNVKAWDEAHQYLTKAGFKTIISSQEIYEHINISKDPELEEPNYYVDRQDIISSSYRALADRVSQEVYVGFLKTFITREYHQIPCDHSEIQYFPRDVPMVKGMKYWINAGAYTGDTIDSLCQNFPEKAKEVKKIWAFEPDLENYLKLVESCDGSPKIKCLPFGLMATKEMIHFNAGGGKGSAVSQTGNKVLGVALDELKLNMKPTFINMDIEGSELSAVFGAQEMIKKYKPDLAICVYHHPAHIWLIIDFLRSLKVGYEFYLRNHSGFVVETVLYATLGKDEAVEIKSEVSEWENIEAVEIKSEVSEWENIEAVEIKSEVSEWENIEAVEIKSEVSEWEEKE